ncbi:hypothetical protein [Cryptosporidium parvum Iowa II]|uniref:Uncharacterized protein n=2 Tax=Cryptosporidium parvum TaxID=5807 RepID=Q5CSM9_CRYPI|nr:hypothetical protein [Cryptosporidium parvum Iowa II]EAK88401.1 hypothetical protein, signal peptide, transmembrane domain near C-terminus [Cryptosporidium parvum Iowa II]QOY43426.1 Uncharacterized protein CPATCC_0037330 [Cryptosporidium parvum]WKS76102.1 hypothetical protein CPCDC_1g2020 [Cryptosporidium sp. 43IA8]WRK30594.1 Uncharacterized protein cpbgf_1002020 [Cryptosporidium parvum]|eukprot:QOY43426.1 hypothetical protein CPATCC_000210 [Cryptosporidium parvum]
MKMIKLFIALILSKIVLNLSSLIGPNQIHLYPSFENSPFITNSWTIGIFVRLKISLWAPLFEDVTDQKLFREILTLCINRGIPPPQPPIFIRILEYEHLTGLTGILFEFPKNDRTNRIVNRGNILQFLMQCREDKLGGEAHIASNILLRNSPTVQNVSSMQEFKLKKIEEDYSMATTFTITFLMVATTLSVISAYVIYYSVAKNSK